MLRKAININGVTKLVVNKVDILEKVKFWKLYEGVNALEFSNSGHMTNYIKNYISEIDNSIQVLFSGNKDAI